MRQGDLAPDFTLCSTEDETVNLYSTLQHSQVVLFFYLKAFTPVCTSEACSFQSSLPAFKVAGASVFGISPDSESMARQFRKAFRLDFPLLLDKTGNVRQAYQVPRLLGLVPGRSTYVVGHDRRIIGVTHAHAKAQLHVEESLRFLQN